MFWPFWMFWVIDSVKISRHVPKAVHGIVVKAATAQQHFPGALKRRLLPGQRNSVAWVARGGELLASCWCVECSWCWNPSLLKYQQFILEMIFWASHIICLLENPRALQCPFLLVRIWQKLRHNHWEAATYMACIQKPWTFTQCMEFMMSPLVSPTEKGRISVPFGLKMYGEVGGCQGGRINFIPGFYIFQ